MLYHSTGSLWPPAVDLWTLLFDLLRGVAEAVVVVVEDGPGEDVDAVVFVCVTSEQRPLQVDPHSCKRENKQWDAAAQSKYWPFDSYRRHCKKQNNKNKKKFLWTLNEKSLSLRFKACNNLRVSLLQKSGLRWLERWLYIDVKAVFKGGFSTLTRKQAG